MNSDSLSVWRPKKGMVGVSEEWRTGAELCRAAQLERGDSRASASSACQVARACDDDRRRFSLCLSQTNRIIKLPATTARRSKVSILEKCDIFLRAHGTCVRASSRGW